MGRSPFSLNVRFDLKTFRSTYATGYGKHLGTIPTPRNIVAVAFSGPGKKTLYVVGGGALAPNGKEFALAEGFRNNAKTMYKIPMMAQGCPGRAK